MLFVTSMLLSCRILLPLSFPAGDNYSWKEVLQTPNNFIGKSHLFFAVFLKCSFVCNVDIVGPLHV